MSLTAVCACIQKTTVAHHVALDTYKKSTIKSNAYNDDMSDAEKKVLLGLDYDRKQDSYDTVDYSVPTKKAKISSFEEMINNYERPVTSKYSKPVAAIDKHDAWRKFTHEESSSLNDDICKVPDINMEPSFVDGKGSVFFKQKLLPKRPMGIASMKRPATVLQEVITQLTIHYT